jgi:hypothetical protein
MKKIILCTLLFSAVILTSCSNDDYDFVQNKNKVDCNVGTSSSNSSLAICLTATERAMPNEILSVASKVNQNNGIPTWTVESGSMKVVNVKTVSDDGQTLSIASIRFKEDFKGGSVSCSFSTTIGIAKSFSTIEQEM